MSSFELRQQRKVAFSDKAAVLRKISKVEVQLEDAKKQGGNVAEVEALLNELNSRAVRYTRRVDNLDAKINKVRQRITSAGVKRMNKIGRKKVLSGLTIRANNQLKEATDLRNELKAEFDRLRDLKKIESPRGILLINERLREINREGWAARDRMNELEDRIEQYAIESRDIDNDRRPRGSIKYREIKREDEERLLSRPKLMSRSTFSSNARDIVEYTTLIMRAKREVIARGGGKDANFLVLFLVIRVTDATGEPGHITINLLKHKTSTQLEQMFYGQRETGFAEQWGSDYEFELETIAAALDLGFFQIYYKKKINLDAGGKIKSNLNTQFGNLICKTYTTRKNNCVLAVFKKFTGVRETYTQMRRNLGLPRNTMIDANDENLMRKICRYFNVSCVVRNTDLTIEIPGKPFIHLYIHQEHAYQVISEVNEEIVTNRDRIVNKKFVYYDLEAVYDYVDNIYKPFSISWCYGDVEKFHLGFDCIDVFLNDIESIEADKIYILGFNNSGFDDYLLHRHLLDNDIKPYVFTFKNRVFLKWRRYETRDVFKYIPPMSLDAFCRAFDLKNKKIGHESFKWGELNIYYNDNGPTQFLEYIEENYLDELREYNKFDVLSIQEGFGLIRELFYKNGFRADESKPIEIEKFYTMGQCARAQLYNSWGKDSRNLYETAYANLQDYNNHRSAMIAGISFADGKIHENVNKCLIDFVSLYPYILCSRDRFYPVGDYVEVERRNPNNMGIYLCRNIDQEVLGDNLNIVPRKTEEGVYSWKDHSIIEERYLNSVDIEQLLEYGCTLEIVSGYEWENCASGFEIFGEYCDRWRKMKQDEDDKKKRGETYSEGTRSFAKLNLNVISGKIAQIFRYEDVYKIIYRGEDQKLEKFVNNHTDVTMGEYNTNYLFIRGKKAITDDEIPKPSTQNLAGFMYSYSRKYMYDNIIHEMEPAIIETDSSTIDMDKVALLDGRTITTIDGEEVPLVYSGGQKYFGQLEIENSNIYLCLAPKKKCYYFEYMSHGKAHAKRRFKGLSRKWINCPPELVENKENMTNAEWVRTCDDLYNRTDINMAPSGEIPIGEDENSCLSKANYYRIFKDEPIYVLQSLITRTFLRGRPNDAPEGNVYKQETLSLKLEYRIKKM
jgi:malonyl CoA-acyl carrier protein transacylase